MQLTFRGEVLLNNLYSRESRGTDVFATQDNWTLREISHQTPIDEEGFYSETLKHTTIKPAVLKASVTRLLKKGLIETHNTKPFVCVAFPK